MTNMFDIVRDERDAVSVNQEEVPNDILLPLKEEYLNSITRMLSSDSDVVRNIGKHLTAKLRNKKDDFHFWYLVYKQVQARDQDSGTLLIQSGTKKQRASTKYHALIEASDFYDVERKIKLDELTGQPNRRAFDEDFTKFEQLQLKHPVTLAVAFIDMDQLKQANDLLGHSGADELIKQVAARLQKATEASSYPCKGFRFGGDELGLLIASPQDDMSALLAEIASLLQSVTGKDFVIGGSSWRQTLSCGVVVLKNTEIDSKENILREADELQYLAKVTRGEDVRNKPKKGISVSLHAALDNTAGMYRGQSPWAVTWLEYTKQDLDTVGKQNFMFGPETEA
jgi:diguanylate cyclase (GGDEF)-like protein